MLHRPVAIERDSLGEVPVPGRRVLRHRRPARALENFPVSGMRPHPELVTATVLVKKCAAEANRALGRLRAARGGRHHRGGRRSARRPPARSVRGGRLPGRRRHLAQHERERGAREPRGGDPRRASAARTPACTRTITSTWASRPTTSSRRRRGWRCSRRRRPWSAAARALSAALEVKAAAFDARPEGRPHAPSGCRADHARTGVRRLRGVGGARRGRRRAGVASSCSS